MRSLYALKSCSALSYINNSEIAAHIKVDQNGQNTSWNKTVSTTV